jgi:hypothetical protein
MCRRTAHHYIKKNENVQNRPSQTTHKVANTNLITHPPVVTRPRPRLTRPLAPAMHHKAASLLMSRMILGTEGEILSKTQALWCFHRYHNVRDMSELRPSHICLGTILSAACHHSWKFCAPEVGVHLCSPTIDSTRNQTSLENTHPTKMC